MDRHAATRRLHHLADDAAVRLPRMHPHMLRYTFVTTMLNAGVDLRDIQIAARHADPRTTMRYDRTPRPTSSMGCAPDFTTLTRPANLGRIWGDDQPPALAAISADHALLPTCTAAQSIPAGHGRDRTACPVQQTTLSN